MSKIERLTEAQEKLLPAYCDKWIDIGLSTTPANKAEAERAINESYKIANLEPPKKIVWCGSPLSQGLTRAIILDKKIMNSVGDSVWDSVRDSVWDSVRGSVRDSVGDSVGDSVRDSVRGSVRDSVWDSVWGSVRDSVWGSVWDSVWGSVRDSVGDSVWDSVRDSVGDSVWDSVWGSVGDSVWDSVYGQHDAHWLGFYEFFREVLNLKKQTQKLSGLTRLSKSAGWALPHQHMCWVSERHQILNRDANGRLHSLTSPAVLYPDGWAIYAVHGVRVPRWVIETPGKITPKLIDKEQNTEIRRVMIDRYGQDKYLVDSGAAIAHQDACGTLYRKDIENDEPLTMVKVINSSVETDGSKKEYFLRVPPDIRTAKDAVAWTFGVKSREYLPLIET